MEGKIKGKQLKGNLKIILGSLSLFSVFSTPFLNITQLSININLFQSAAYSFILLSFWLIAATVLEEKKSVHESIQFSKQKQYPATYHKPVTIL